LNPFRHNCQGQDIGKKTKKTAEEKKWVEKENGKDEAE
jgi:hypothetical protein